MIFNLLAEARSFKAGLRHGYVKVVAVPLVSKKLKTLEK